MPTPSSGPHRWSIVRELRTTPGQGWPIIGLSRSEIAKADPLELRLPSEDLVVGGTIVQGAGGYTDGSTALERDIPASCGFGPDQEITVFNAEDDPIVPT
jgi:hypothetical protein